jgi:hypothetical protein
VLFPLPVGDQEYVKYAEKVRSLLPAADLTSVDLGGHTYVTAPIRDLPFLYPKAAPAPGPAAAAKLYTPRSTPLSQP